MSNQLVKPSSQANLPHINLIYPVNFSSHRFLLIYDLSLLSHMTEMDEKLLIVIFTLPLLYQSEVRQYWQRNFSRKITFSFFYNVLTFFSIYPHHPGQPVGAETVRHQVRVCFTGKISSPSPSGSHTGCSLKPSSMFFYRQLSVMTVHN